MATEYGLDRSNGGITLALDAEAHEYRGAGTVHGFPVVLRVVKNGFVDGAPSLLAFAHDAPVAPNEPRPEWMRETREQLGLVAPRRELPKRLVDDPYPF